MDPNLRFPQAWELEVWTQAHACVDVKFYKKSLEVIWVTHGSTGGDEGLGTANYHGERAGSVWREHIPPQQELNAPPSSSDSRSREKLSNGTGDPRPGAVGICCCPGAGGTWHNPPGQQGPSQEQPSSQELCWSPWWARQGQGKGEQTGTAEGGAFASGAKGKVLQETRTENERKRQVNGFMD